MLLRLPPAAPWPSTCLIASWLHLAAVAGHLCAATQRPLVRHISLSGHPYLPLVYPLQVIFVLPTAYPVTKENLNYAGVAVGVVLLFSLG